MRLYDHSPNAETRLIEAVNLKAQEAVLTGESESVDKHSRTLEGGDYAQVDRKNMIYMGTVVIYGRGHAVVLIFVVAGLMYMHGAGWKMMFMTAISMAVAAIPEGLPPVRQDWFSKTLLPRVCELPFDS